MLNDKQYQEVMAKNISLFLNINIIEIIDILESDKVIDLEKLFKY